MRRLPPAPARAGYGETMREARDAAAVIASVLVLLLWVPPGFAGDTADDAWEALVKGGHVALIRHGNAPPGYGGDPPGFRIDDCKTQRNLDEVGRDQAKALGEAFRKRGVVVQRILASPVCRCTETGQLMAVGPVETSWALVPDRGSSTSRLEELEQIVSSWRGPGTLVLVTHGITVARLTGVTLAQAETLVLQPTPEKPPGGHLPRGGSLVGRISPPR
jgi:phosphohistidine phosphatase SixA